MTVSDEEVSDGCSWGEGHAGSGSSSRASGTADRGDPLGGLAAAEPTGVPSAPAADTAAETELPSRSPRGGGYQERHEDAHSASREGTNLRHSQQWPLHAAAEQQQELEPSPMPLSKSVQQLEQRGDGGEGLPSLVAPFVRVFSSTGGNTTTTNTATTNTNSSSTGTNGSGSWQHALAESFFRGSGPTEGSRGESERSSRIVGSSCGKSGEASSRRELQHQPALARHLSLQDSGDEVVGGGPPSTCGCEPPGPRAAHSCDSVDDCVFLFGGWNGNSPMSDLYVLEVLREGDGEGESKEGHHRYQWHLVPPNKHTPAARNNHTSAVAGTEVYIHGGHDGSQWLADFHILDAAAVINSGFKVARWKAPQVSGQKPSARACHTLSRVRQKLFLFGGYDGHRCFNDIEILDLETLAWIQPKVSGEKPLPRNAHSMAVVESRLFLFGGHSGSKHLTDLHIFDTPSLTWFKPQLSGSVPPGLRGHSATLVGSKMFLFGGFDGRRRTNEVCVLCTRSLTWRSPKDSQIHAPTGRQRHSAALVSQRRILIFGGFDGAHWLADLHELDTSKLNEAALSGVAIKQLLQNLRQLLQGGDFSDVTLVVGGKRLPAHKNILAANCAFFRQMFLGQMKESMQQEVIIQGWTPEAYSAMLEFLYTGTLSETRPTVLSEVLGLADHYTLSTLKRYCESVLCMSLDASSVCCLLRCAERYQAKKLKQSCVEFIFRHSDIVSQTPEFEQLQAIPSLMMEIAKMSLSNHRARASFGAVAAASETAPERAPDVRRQ
ncbi:leucine-zipper-like transcriptional regulator 1 [Cyclospora cayetanensis]|uniref:Leucine-zipper-like transcriptional regulator 1 n=1 Tax=Cyclospora cayetanensis TaxID=88456 RepID=A0A6P6S0X8_9EIME|nr:leucine-zipper-like transcriptional regulator 1 [Cyclospora cayetanensis]